MTLSVRIGFARALVALLAFAGAPALAEDSALGFERTPPRLSFTDGDVSYWRPGASDWSDARVNTALAAGDELSTGPGANLELQVGSRAWVRAGEATQLGLTSLEPDFLQLKLTTGTTSLDLRELGAGHTLEIDTPNAGFTIERPGFYRVEVANDATTFTTRRGGRATVATTGGLPSAIAANEQLVVTGADAPVLASFGAPALDDWDRWNYSRAEQQANPASARYVPAGVYGADDLDRYGGWRTVPTYGAVWVPRVVVGWTPYSTGSWVADPYYGWTWVDDAPWGWAPFHYGRWVYVGGYWAWSPGPRVVRAYYAPALVAFYGSSNFSIGVSFGAAPYTGWVALGWGEPIVPWWGPRGCRGQARWAGWSGPRVVNNVVVNNTFVNVNQIRRYEHADRQGAFVAVERNRFGRGNVREARVSNFDRSQLRPVRGGDMGVRSERSTRVSADHRREAPAREVRERRVVTRRAALEPGMRDPTRAGTRDARQPQARERSAVEATPRQDRADRARRSSAPPTRMARAAESEQRRSVSERAPMARGDARGSARGRERAAAPLPAPAARSREARGSGVQERASRGERGAEPRVPAPGRRSETRAPENRRPEARGPQRGSTREASPQAPRASGSPPRERSRPQGRAERPTRERQGSVAPREQREAPRTREVSPEPAPRSYGEGARSQRFEQPARSENQQRPARRERDAAPQSVPAPSNSGPGQGSGSGDGGGRRGNDGWRSRRG